MALFVRTKTHRRSVALKDVVAGEGSRPLTLAGAGAVQRLSLGAGETGEIIRLDHHLTLVRSGITDLVSHHEGKALESRHVRAGSIHVRPALTPHASQWSHAVDITVVGLEVRFLRDHAADLFRRDLSAISIQPVIGAEDSFLWHLGARLDDFISESSPPTVFVEQLLASIAMHLALTANAGPPLIPARALSGGALRRVTDYIEANLTSDLRLGNLAELLNISTYHFSRQFSREMGIGVGRYIQLRRMSLASNLLGGTSLSIAEISERVGYSDARSFSRAFLDVYGLSPQAYRRAAS